MWTKGVVVRKKVAKGEADQYRWYCLATGKCREQQFYLSLGTSKSSSNAVKHLKGHGIESERSKSMSASKIKHVAAINEMKQSKLYYEDETRAFEFAYTIMAVRNLLPHCLVESSGFRFFAEIVAKPSLNLHMHAKMVNTRIVELYHSIKTLMIEKIRTDCHDTKLPMMHLLVDEWSCKQLKQRFIAIRVSYINEYFEPVSMMLSVRHFDRSLMTEDFISASHLLKDWTLSVLREFGIDQNMLFSATTDAGPDVRCMTSKLMGLEWEWCAAHLLANATKEACGMLKSQSKEENKMRYILKTINSMTARIQNSKHAIQAYSKISKSILGRSLELKPYVEIRFLGALKTLQRILIVWPCLQKVYEQHFGEDFPLSGCHDMIIQVCPILSKLQNIQENSQTSCDPVAATTLIKLLEFERTILCIGEPIPINDGMVVAGANVHPDVDLFRKNLREALNKRFFNRYRTAHPTDSIRGAGSPATSNLFEMCTVMNPSFKRLSCLDGIIAKRTHQEYAENLELVRVEVKAKIHDKVLALATKVAKSKKSCSSTQRHIHFTELESDDEVCELADAFTLNAIRDTVVAAPILGNFERYLHEIGQRKQTSAKELLAWWKNKSAEYPFLSQVARCLLGVKASSGTVELDIGIAGMYLPKNRLSMSSQNLEMKLFIKRNEIFLDWNQIKCIEANNLAPYLPPAPCVPFVEQPDAHEPEDIFA